MEIPKFMKAVAVIFIAVFAIAMPFTLLMGGEAVLKEVQKLLKAEVGEETILKYISTNGAPEKLTADEIVELKKSGASQAVIIALMGGARGETAGKEDFPFDLDEHHSVDKPVVHGLMAIYPIKRKIPASIGNYITLDEAVQQKVATVKEKGEGTVPNVIIRNSGRIPIYITAGEIIIGGKQDRIIAYDVIIHPDKEITVEVRCVEQGRWNGARSEFAPAKAMGGMKSRAAAQFKSQQKVWDEVAEQNASVQVSTSTGTYQASLNKPEVQKMYEEYSAKLLPSLDDRNTVGMVVSMNGKVSAVEIFGSPGLFAKMKDKLLKSYVLDAAGMKDEKAKPASKDEILSFYKAAMKAEAEKLKAYDDNVNVKRNAEPCIANENKDAEGNFMRRSILAK